jgi:ATP-dependent Clp protease ATP-binding subunit ClpX
MGVVMAEAMPEELVIEVSKRADAVCGFCLQSRHKVTMLIAGPAAYICDECIRTGTGVLAQKAVEDEIRAKAVTHD